MAEETVPQNEIDRIQFGFVTQNEIPQENKAIFEDNVDSLASGGDARGNSCKAERGGWSNWEPKKHLSQHEESSKSGRSDTPKSYTKSNATEPSSAWGKSVIDSENEWLGKGESSDWSNRGPKKGQLLREELPHSACSHARKSSDVYNATETSVAWGKHIIEANNAERNAWSNCRSKDEPEELSKSGSWNLPKFYNASRDNKVAKTTDALQPQTRQEDPKNAWEKAGSVEAPSIALLGSKNSAKSVGWDSADKDTVLPSQWGQKTDLTGQDDKSESCHCLREESSKQSRDIASSDGLKWGLPSGTAWKKNSHESSSGWASDRLTEKAESRSWKYKGGHNSHDGARGCGTPKANEQVGFEDWESDNTNSRRPSCWQQQDGSSQESSNEASGGQSLTYVQASAEQSSNSMNKKARMDEQGSSSSKLSSPDILRFVQTLPRTYYLRKDNIKRQLPQAQLDQFKIHGIWDTISKGKRDEEIDVLALWPRDVTVLPYNDLPTDAFARWPSLRNATKSGAQEFWTYEWNEHARCHNALFTKEIYIDEACNLHQQYDMTAILRTIAENLQQIPTTKIEGTLWHGIQAIQLFNMIRDVIQAEPIISCYKHDGYWLVEEISVVLEYNGDENPPTLLNLTAYQPSWKERKTRGNKAAKEKAVEDEAAGEQDDRNANSVFEDEDIVWFTFG